MWQPILQVQGTILYLLFQRKLQEKLNDIQQEK